MPPKTKEELVSFLQMLAYLSRYFSNFSSRCEPLKPLIRVKAKFSWTTERQAAFEDLKSAITSAPVLVPYYPERDTLVICDGSPTGLGGGLFQKTQHGYQPVHYVSRTLTDAQRRYSQIERETLAVEFLATDHKPLLPLFKQNYHQESGDYENAEPGLYHDNTSLIKKMSQTTCQDPRSQKKN